MTRLKRKKELPSDNQNDVRFGTPEIVAEYRAKRICENADTVIEVGAGAGFQTRAFAKHAKHVIAVEIDEERFSRFADVPKNVTKIVGDAMDEETIEKIKKIAQGRIVVFLDPERPAQAKERTLSEIQPNITLFVKEYRKITPELAIELPPFLQDIPFLCEKEYLSIDGQLNRLTIYIGQLKKADVSVAQLPSGERIAHNGKPPYPIEKTVDRPRFIIMVDRAVMHAELAPLVLPHECAPLYLGNAIAYLSSEKPTTAFARAYRVIVSGNRQSIAKQLRGYGKVVLHGKMGPELQRRTLAEFNAQASGKKTAHIFVGKKFYLPTQE